MKTNMSLYFEQILIIGNKIASLASANIKWSYLLFFLLFFFKVILSFKNYSLIREEHFINRLICYFMCFFQYLQTDTFLETK